MEKLGGLTRRELIWVRKIKINNIFVKEGNKQVACLVIAMKVE